MPGRERLLQSIRPGMKLDRAFFLKIYGYEISFPGFRETAIKALEDAGCSMAWDYYIAAVAGYNYGHRQQLKEVGEWYLKECEKEWKKKMKEGEVKRRQEEIKLLKRKKLLLMQKSQLLNRE